VEKTTPSGKDQERQFAITDSEVSCPHPKKRANFF
jgi:hypothetical protein